MTEEQKKKVEEIINLAEGKYKKDLDEIFDNFHEGYVPFALLFHYGDTDTFFYYYNPISMLFGYFIPLSFTLSQMGGCENEFFEFLGDCKDKAAENIIDIAVSLSEVFSKNITKEEAEKLLFIKNDIEKENIGYGKIPACLGKFRVFTEEFIKIIEQYKSEDTYNIKSVSLAIGNYFNEKKENENNNKINNVVENTAKEKIMSNNDELTLNLLILGQTGVGKSSLLNALVGKEVDETRVGKPITRMGIFPYEAEIDGKKVVIYDSWGLEVDKATKWEGIIEEELKKRSADKDIKDWFHSVTYCIQAGGDRVQDFDLKIIKKFIDKKYNVIVALTKADHINEDKEEEFINTIKKETGIDTVISISAKPERKRGETETPKPFGLPEYKAAILISWRKIFIDRIPLHIIEKLKEDIENAKYNAPRKGKDKELTAEIQKYFSDILNTNIQKYVRENIEKYYKINIDIFSASKNIKLSDKKLDSDFYSQFDFAEEIIIEAFRNATDSADVIGAILALVITSPVVIPFTILEYVVVKPIEFLHHLLKGRKEDIEYFINRVSEEYIEKIGGEEFESEIRKIIIDTLNEIDKKIIKLN